MTHPWDTQQDYLYAVSGIGFQSERLPKAVNAKGTKDNLDKISAFCGYSKNALDRCVGENLSRLAKTRPPEKRVAEEVLGRCDRPLRAVLAASIFHFGEATIGDAHAALASAGVPVRTH